MWRLVRVFAIGVFLMPAVASASTISLNMTVDDAFTLYVSTNDSVAGTQVCTGTNWQVVYTCNLNLTPGVANYLHVEAHDVAGLISAFIGTFTLSDSLFQFANGTQVLNTNPTSWAARLGSFGGSNLVPISYGANGAGPWPWGSLNNIDPSAEWIWENSSANCTGCTVYFSAAVTPTTAAPVPEPATVGLFGAGLVLLAAQVRRAKIRKAQ